MKEEFVMKRVDKVVVGGKMWTEYEWLMVGKLGSVLLLWV